MKLFIKIVNFITLISFLFLPGCGNFFGSEQEAERKENCMIPASMYYDAYTRLQCDNPNPVPNPNKPGTLLNDPYYCGLTLAIIASLLKCEDPDK